MNAIINGIKYIYNDARKSISRNPGEAALFGVYTCTVLACGILGAFEVDLSTMGFGVAYFPVALKIIDYIKHNRNFHIWAQFNFQFLPKIFVANVASV